MNQVAANTSDTSATTATPITVAYGDGIGPEIMKAALLILQEAGAKLDIEEIEIGKKVYERGITAGIEPDAWQSLRRTQVFLKAPITTPQGGGYKSLNVTTRKTLGLYANVRPCVSYYPFIRTKHPHMDVVIIRENEEDTYAGIEHQQTAQVTQCLKLITRPGCEKIVRYAFEYAKANGRRKVSCFTKDNIMKHTDGLFHQVFNEIGEQYPDIEKDHWIIDIGTARLADSPDIFDVIVTGNLYGDIISDVAAQITGSVGICGSANIGRQCAMFEAIHGSAPDIAGQDIANPSGLILASIMMLVHVNQPEVAAKIHNAWLTTIESGVHTGDIFDDEDSRQQVGTQAFAEAVIANLGRLPHTLPVAEYHAQRRLEQDEWTQSHTPKKDLLGVDVFLDWSAGSAKELGQMLESLNGDGLKLKMITNRGVKVYPDGFEETFCTDHWRCRYVTMEEDKPITHQQVIGLLQRVNDASLDCIKTENLYAFDGERGYSLGQGE